MLSNEFGAQVPVEALRATSFGAGANNGPWLPVKDIEGVIDFIFNIGAVTGSVVLKLQDATDGTGTGAADLSPAVTTASLSTPGGTARLAVDKRKIRSHVRIVATVTTGPILIAAIAIGRAKAS